MMVVLLYAGRMICSFSSQSTHKPSVCFVTCQQSHREFYKFVGFYNTAYGGLHK